MAMVHVQQSSSPSILTVLQNLFSLHSVLGKERKKKKSGRLSKRVLILYFYIFLKTFFPTVLKYIELN